MNPPLWLLHQNWDSMPSNVRDIVEYLKGKLINSFLRMNDFRLQLERTYSELPDIFFTKLSPTPVKNPEMIIFNKHTC